LRLNGRRGDYLLAGFLYKPRYAILKFISQYIIGPVNAPEGTSSGYLTPKEIPIFQGLHQIPTPISIILRLVLLLCLTLTGACAPASDAPAIPPAAEMTTEAATVPAPTAVPVPTATKTPEPPLPAIWIDPALPSGVRALLTIPAGMQTTGDTTAADVRIAPGRGTRTIASWVYALAAPFPTIPDGVTEAELVTFWKTGTAPGFPATQIIASPETVTLLSVLWGPPSSAVKPQPAADLLTLAWKNTGTWAVVPFDELVPRWKVIEIDGRSPLHNEFDTEAYPLAIKFNVVGPEELVNQFTNEPIFNRDPDKLTTVVLTGVTALVRGTAALMRGFGMEYPASFIGPWLQEADILHINNEVPFAQICPNYPPENELVFCSRPEYIKLLEYIGADVIELSGDHFHDYGDEAILFTLEMYKERGWPYYGGGANIEEARRPLIMEHNGNRIAFLGCNGKPSWYAQASETKPGAWSCDIPWLEAEIARLRAEGYLVIMTFQHEEVATYGADPRLMADFRPVADAGATIVSGSQAHQPHAIEFRGDAFIHYGLGNLFFDQLYISDPNAEAFIDRHVIYDGRHISTELLTIQFVDYARARPMTDEERQRLLETIFNLSIWN
jgi:hypothetical protein